jgi:hypothetical protein
VARSVLHRWYLLWYEQYKLTGIPGSVWLFAVVPDWLHIGGYEKPLRLFVASMGIAAAVLVVLLGARMWGAACALGVMSGAIFFHLASPLGSDPYHDGGALFKEACTVWLCAAFILPSYRAEVRAAIAGPLGRIRFSSP